MKRLLFVINRAAREGRSTIMKRQAQRCLWGWPLEFCYPASPEQVAQICHTAHDQDYEAIVIIGGDGTVNAALPGLLHDDCPPIIPYPAGTANDLASQMHIRPDWNQVQHLVDHKYFRKVDTVVVNEKPFATVGGVGIGSVLTSDINRYRQISPIFSRVYQYCREESYSIMAAYTILARQDFVRKVEIESEEFNGHIQASSLLVSNQPLLGGDLLACPYSKNDDGQVEVSIISTTSKAKLFRSLLKGRIGRKGFPFDHRFQTKKLRIKSADHRPLPFFGDGDFLTENHVLDIEVCPAAIKVFEDPHVQNWSQA